MHRFIAYLLIFSVIATNVAWAMDDCSSQYSNSEVSGLALSSGLSSDNQSNNVCDERCVGWLHLVAITPTTKLNYFPFTRQEVVRTDISFHSLDKMPPIDPHKSKCLLGVL